MNLKNMKIKQIMESDFDSFQDICLELFEYQQFFDDLKDQDYDAYAKRIIKGIFEFFLNDKISCYPAHVSTRDMLIHFYKDNEKGKNSVWLKESINYCPSCGFSDNLRHDGHRYICSGCEIDL